MKICPFLVAGDESLHHRGTMSLRTTSESPLLEITRNEADPAAPAEQRTATELWAMEEASAPRSGLECLGDPCRFFHAGGCRFDLLFAPGSGAGQATPGVAPDALLLQEADSDGASLGSVLQEVWSLQRESLKEMIGGFRRFEGEQARQQATLTGKLEQLATHVEEARRDNPELARLLDERLAGLQAAVPALEVTQRDVAATRTAVEDTCADIAATRGDLLTTRQEVESSRTSIEALRTSLESVCGQVDAVREESRRILQENLETTRQLLGESAEATRVKIEALMAQNSSASRADLEQSLQRVLEDNQDVRGLRAELQQALQTLAGHVREVATAATSLAASSRLAEDLLVEQRTFAEALLERERRDEARRLNNAGVLAYHEAAYDTSVDKFRKAVQLDPGLAEAWNNLGLSYTELRAETEALEAFKKALEIDPNVGQVYNNLGYLYHRRGEFAAAVEMYERATHRAADSSAAWSNLGNALHALARRDEAMVAWRRALELDPTNDKASTALARLGLGAEL